MLTWPLSQDMAKVFGGCRSTCKFFVAGGGGEYNHKIHGYCNELFKSVKRWAR